MLGHQPKEGSNFEWGFDPLNKLAEADFSIKKFVKGLTETLPLDSHLQKIES